MRFKYILTIASIVAIALPGSLAKASDGTEATETEEKHQQHNNLRHHHADDEIQYKKTSIAAAAADDGVTNVKIVNQERRKLENQKQKKELPNSPPPRVGSTDHASKVNNLFGGNDDGSRANNLFGGNGNNNKPNKFKPKHPDQEPIANQWIVIFKDDAVVDDNNTINGDGVKNKLKDKATKFRGNAGKHTFKTFFKGGVVKNMNAADAELLSQEDDVLVVEQDSVIHAEQRDISWGQDRMDQRTLPLDDVYTAPNDGSGVTAYVLDSWLLTEHDEFEGRASLGYNPADVGECDDEDHGTHVAGTIGGKTFGIAPGVDIVSIIVLDCSGSGSGWWSDAIAGMEWAATDCKSRDGKCVANLSIGGGINSAADRAARDLWNSGVFVAVSAGNSDRDACDKSLASADKVCAVGSTTDGDRRSSFSNFGQCVDIFAPGSEILSAYASSNTATGYMWGTSMASPHIAGLAALHFKADENQTPDDVLDAIIAHSTKNAVGDVGSGSPNRLAYADSSLGFSCSPTCVNGNCAAPNVCECDDYWTGGACDVFITNVCGNGACEPGSGETMSSCPEDCCTLPTSSSWFIITNDECTDGIDENGEYHFGTSEEITLILYDANIVHSEVEKIECEFKVVSDSGRKTKYKLDSAAELNLALSSPALPSYHEASGTYRLKILMSDIGRIGGWDGGVTPPPNNPIVEDEWTTYKFKLQDANNRYEAKGNNLFATAVASDPECVTSGKPNFCNDNNPCTNDVCDTSVGCVYTNNNNPCDDGCSDTSDQCQDGVCVGTPTTSCDDGNICTDDSYNPSTCSCAYVLNNFSCDDGNACTTSDECADGSCFGGPALNCNDGNVCTDDVCDTVAGCVYTNNNNPCDDGSLCTTGDTCSNGSCNGTPVDCDDGNVCTNDSCHPITGCAHTNNSAQCDDGDSCTVNDVCAGGSCSGTPKCPDDGYFCNGVESCSGGTCSNSGNPCSGSRPYCVESRAPGDKCVGCVDNSHCTVSGEVCNLPTGSCGSASCSLPTKPEWLTIGINGQEPCSELRNVGINDQLTMVFYSQDITVQSSFKKIEVEFKVMGDKDRKTKWRIQSDFFNGTNQRPHAFTTPDGLLRRFRLVVNVNLIEGSPVQPGEWISWKWKVETTDGLKVELRSSDAGSGGVINVL